MDPILSFLGSIAKHLKGYGPDGVLVVGLLGAYIGGSKAGLSEWPFILVIAIVWCGYLGRGVIKDRHTERLKELEIAKIEKNGEMLKQKFRKPRKPRKSKGTP